MNTTSMTPKGSDYARRRNRRGRFTEEEKKVVRTLIRFHTDEDFKISEEAIEKVCRRFKELFLPDPDHPEADQDGYRMLKLLSQLPAFS